MPPLCLCCSIKGISSLLAVDSARHITDHDEASRGMTSASRTRQGTAQQPVIGAGTCFFVTISSRSVPSKMGLDWRTKVGELQYKKCGNVYKAIGYIYMGGINHPNMGGL